MKDVILKYQIRIIKATVYTASCTCFRMKRSPKNYKIKENEVTNFIIQQFSSTTIVQDRRIQDGCSARRPDVLIDLGYQVLIIEVDENQHTEYDCSCVNKRLMQFITGCWSPPNRVHTFQSRFLSRQWKKHNIVLCSK